MEGGREGWRERDPCETHSGDMGELGGTTDAVGKTACSGAMPCKDG